MKKLLTAIFCVFLTCLTAHASEKSDIEWVIHGVQDEMQANVISRVQIEKAALVTPLTDAVMQAFAKESIAAVKAALAPYGYYTPTVSAHAVYANQHWQVIYNIQLGQPVRVQSVNITITGSGSENIKILNKANQFPLHRGDIFNSIVYTSARDKLYDVINNQGYIKAIARESKVLVNPATQSADIILTIDTKERYYYGKVHFNQNAYDPEFMQRFDIFHHNEPYSSDEVLEYQQDMNNSRYFKQVLVIPEVNNPQGNLIPMQVSAIPVNARRYDLGLGYGTFTGPRLTAGVHFRRITDTGHSLDALLKLSTVLSGVGAKYNIPGRNPLTDQWSFGINFQKFAPKNGFSRSKNLMGGYTKKMHRWTAAANINYLWERYSVNNEPNHDSKLLYPNLNLSYLRTDSVVQPTYGQSLNLTLQGASKTVVSSTSFLQGELKGKLFMSPTTQSHLILRGDLGYTVVHDLNDLPLSMRFFAGGMTTVRGFPDSSIGPGKYLGVASIEFRHHIAYDISGAAFYDVGTATNHFDTPLNRGAGLGLVYESIIGPIKLYAGKAISKHGQPWSIELGMGPEF